MKLSATLTMADTASANLAFLTLPEAVTEALQRHYQGQTTVF